MQFLLGTDLAFSDGLMPVLILIQEHFPWAHLQMARSASGCIAFFFRLYYCLSGFVSGFNCFFQAKSS